MMKDLLLAVDQGTSGCKMTVFDIEGQVIASVTKGYDTYYPKDQYVEQDCNVWWTVIKSGIKELVSNEHVHPEAIKGIGVDGISWACIPIDKTGEVLAPTMIWLDRRATEEAEWMKQTVGEDKLISISGNPVDAAYITPKMLWLKKHKPQIYKNTYKFLQSNAFIVYRFTGNLSQDYSQGYGFHYFDISKGEWDKTVADQLGISLDLMAPLKYSHEIIGGVTEAVAMETGLKAGTPVVAGGLDAACCTLGAGVIEVGQTQEQGGQAGGMSICMDQPMIHEKLILGYHVIPDKWLLQGGTTGGGGTLRWFNNEFGINQKHYDLEINAFEALSNEAKSVDPGSDGVIFLPYMKGERSPLWNSNAKGMYYGLSYNHSRAHMVRSTMEGVAYSLLHNIDTAKEAGAEVSVLSSVGGSSNSHVWMQAKADITNKTIEVPYSDHATTLGAAILAGIGVGIYKDYNEAIEKTVNIQRVYKPIQKNVEIYKRHYQQYLKLSALMTQNIW